MLVGDKLLNQGVEGLQTSARNFDFLLKFILDLTKIGHKILIGLSNFTEAIVFLAINNLPQFLEERGDMIPNILERLFITFKGLLTFPQKIITFLSVFQYLLHLLTPVAHIFLVALLLSSMYIVNAVHLVVLMPILQNAVDADQHLLFLAKCLVFFMVLGAYILGWFPCDESQIFGEEGDRLYIGGGMALGAVDPAAVMQSVAATLAEGMTAYHEQTRDVEFVVELSLAVGADHNGYYY